LSDSVEAAIKAAEVHLQETHSALSYRGDRLWIIDTSVVPERPSSPTVRLCWPFFCCAGPVHSPYRDGGELFGGKGVLRSSWEVIRH
jgi:hypothetical protein